MLVNALNHKTASRITILSSKKRGRGLVSLFGGFSSMGLFDSAHGCYFFGFVWKEVTHVKLNTSQSQFLVFFPRPDLPPSMPFSALRMAAPSFRQKPWRYPDGSPSHPTSNPSGDPTDSAFKRNPEPDHSSPPPLFPAPPEPP